MANEKHLLVTFSGGWNQTNLANEVWQYGVRCAMATGSLSDVGTLSNSWGVVANTVARTETDWRIDGNWAVTELAANFNADDWLNDQIAPAVATLFSARSAFSNGCRLDQIKVYPIGTTGRSIPAPPYASGSPMVLTYTSANPVGGSSGNLLPIQNSVVVSHRTAQIGRRGRGRSYWPGTTVGLVDTDGLMSTTLAAAQAGFEAAFLEGIAIDGSGPGTGFSIRPAVIGAPWTQYAVINSVNCGVVIDTQRRRRNKLDENVQTAAVSY